MKHLKKTLLSTIITGSSMSLLATAPITFAEETDTAKNMEVIIVSSTRTGTDLASTSAAVTAISNKTLIDAGVSDPTNLQDIAPNLSIDRAGSSGIQITIRGVSSTDNTEKGDPSASFLQDGIYIARPQAQEVSFFDLDQVEVLRGPQGTLYGRNATAGLVNLISAKPTIDDTYGSFDATLGDYGRRQATLMMNLPISDTAALRGAINVDKRDTFLNEHPDEQYDINPDKDNVSVRLSGLFELSDDVSLLVRADHSTIKGLYNNTVSLTNFYDFAGTSIPESGRGQDFNYIADGKSSDALRTRNWADIAQKTVDNSTWGVMAELEWAISDNIEMTYLGSYRQFDRKELNITGFGGIIDGEADTGLQEFVGNYKQLSNELRFTYSNDIMNLQGGFYSFEEESGVSFLILNSLEGFAGEFSVFGFPQDPTISKSDAIFAQGTFNVADDVRLIAGARYTQDEKSRQGNTIFHQFRDEPINYTPGPDNNIPDSKNDAKVNYSETTWKLGAEYDIEDNILLYGTISTGYKAGGFNDGCLEGSANCNSPVTPEFLYYNPETLTAYELGLKMDLDNGLRTFISVFNYDYEDLQLSTIKNVCGDDCQVTTNAGAADVTGIEVENRYYITENDKLDFSITWLDAEYTDWQLNPTVNLKGEKLNRSPEFTANLRYQHIFELDSGADFTLEIASRYSDEYVLFSEGAIANFVQPAFHKTDMSVTFNPVDREWYIQGYVKNIEDEITLSNADLARDFPSAAGGEASLSDPRTMGIRFGLEF